MSQAIVYETSWLLAEAAVRTHITDTLRFIEEEYHIRGREVIEFGSGIGNNLEVFARANKVLGVEGLESAVRESQSRGIAAIVANLEDEIPLADSSADWLLCIDVLEHLMNPRACLASAHRVLRNDGYMVVNVPNHFDLGGRLAILFGSGIDSKHYFVNSSHWEYPHVRFFSRRSIENLLVACGFEVVRDFGPRFVSFPKIGILGAIGVKPILRPLQRRWPDMFSGGFFLLCRKRSTAA